MPKPKPIYALPAQERREVAEKFTGLPCTIQVRPFRDNDNDHNHTVTGVILGVAVPNTAAADQLIVRINPRQYLRAISLATIYLIEVT